MNLQELFKTYYEKAKTTEKTQYLNSAKGSLNSFSSYLEKKRQKVKQQKEEEIKGTEAASTDKTQAADTKQEDVKENVKD